MLNGIGAIILAGGQSKRMGQDKALLTLAGKTFLESITDLATSLFSETLVVVDHPSKTQGLKLSGAKVVTDLFAEAGPLSGIYTGLAHSKAKANLVLTCDMPFIDAQLIHSLAACWTEKYDVVCFKDRDGRLQPFPGIYSSASKVVMYTLLLWGQASLHRFFDGASEILGIDIPSDKIPAFANLNTPEDYKMAFPIFAEDKQTSSHAS